MSNEYQLKKSQKVYLPFKRLIGIFGSIRMKPGLSGYAQIHKRGDLDPGVKAMYDYIYMTKFSLWLDIKIFVYIILKLFPIRGEGERMESQDLFVA